jgi:sterol desaturase/sphingolipid hydroxylase (fatty acid hydroxylase superfamily)
LTSVTGDVLTAPADSVPRRRADALTLGDCWRSFIRRSSPRLLGLAILGALGLRVLLGDPSWRDAVWVAGLIAVTPPIEWLIHVYILHAKPLRLGRFRLDLMAAQEHRAHHREPSILNGVLIPAYAIFIFVPMIAVTIWVMSFPIALILGGDRLAQASTGLVVAYAILASYEWSHYLIHTPYRPRSRYYRSIWRGHRLHHYKNEHYWFGVTSPVGDRLLRTAPDQSSVSRSSTARTLESS